MDRVELREYFEDVRAKARRWYEESVEAVKEADAVLDEMKAYFHAKGMGCARGRAVVKITAEEERQYEEAKALAREAHEQLIFFDGVLKGVEAVVAPLGIAMAREELANAGRIIPKVNKPRRK